MNVLSYILAGLFLIAFYVTLIVVGTATIRQLQKLTTARLATVGQLKRAFLFFVPMVTALVLVGYYYLKGRYTAAWVVLASSICILLLLKQIGVTSSVENFPMQKLCGGAAGALISTIQRISVQEYLRSIESIFNAGEQEYCCFCREYDYKIDKISVNGNIEVKME